MRVALLLFLLLSIHEVSADDELPQLLEENRIAAADLESYRYALSLGVSRYVSRRELSMTDCELPENSTTLSDLLAGPIENEKWYLYDGTEHFLTIVVEIPHAGDESVDGERTIKYFYFFTDADSATLSLISGDLYMQTMETVNDGTLRKPNIQTRMVIKRVDEAHSCR